MSWQKRLRPAVKRAIVAEVMTIHALSQRRACGLVGITRRGFQRPHQFAATAAGVGRTTALVGLPHALSDAASRRLARQSQTVERLYRQEACRCADDAGANV